MSQLETNQPPLPIKEAVNTTSKLALRVPDHVRGMTTLDKEKFTTVITFPVVTVEVNDINRIRSKVRLERYLIKNMNKLKNLMDSEDPSLKLLVFDPDTVKEDDGKLKEQIIRKIENVLCGKSLYWSVKDYVITFENWDMKRILRAVLPKHLEFSSFTQTGHIIHCNFRDDLSLYKTIIGQILLEKISQCRTVVNKLDGITNKYRNFEIELIAGTPDYIAEVTEGALRYELDFSKVFWNSRLGHEHDRVLKQFDSRSLVYDACAGVGPFALPAVKRIRARRVIANDLNPDSVYWMRKNVTLNKIASNKIDIHNLDATEFIRGPVADDIINEISKCIKDPELTPPTGAHIMMNLPAYAVNFLPVFKGMLAEKVALISNRISEVSLFPVTAYCYLFAKAHEDVPYEWFEKQAEEMVLSNLDWPTAKIKLLHHVRTVSSRKEMFCVHIELPWDLLVYTEGFSNTTTYEPPQKMKKTT